MTRKIDMKEIERRAFRSTFQDGVWDIYLGLLLLTMGTGPLLYRLGIHPVWVLLILVVLALLDLAVFWVAKKFITLPRMGRVKFGPQGKARKKKMAAIFTISIIVGVATLLAALSLYSSPPQWNNPGLIFSAFYVLNMLVIFSLGAYILAYERLYIIGLLFALPMPALILVDEYAGIDLGFAATGIPAGIILLIGLIVFIKFLLDYPVPSEEQ